MCIRDRDGCLQDSHWSGGAFGYFPSYALGSAYGAQMLRRMEQDVDVWGAAAKGDLTPITAWLREKVHQYGGLMEPADVVKNACGDFSAEDYILMKQKEQLATQEQKLEELTLKIEDVETLLEDVSGAAYDRCV